MKKRDIKLDILKKLVKTKGLRYAQIRPKGVENDLYNYHLQSLVKEGYVEKQDAIYKLTLKGQKYAAIVKPINPLGVKDVLLKQNALCVVSKHENNQLMVLNQIRNVHPFYGKKGILGGTLKPGEKIIDGASRKLKEECGLDAKFQYSNSFRSVFLYNNGEIFQDIIFHICYSDSCTGELISLSEFGENFWTDINTAIQNENDKLFLPLDPMIKFLKLLRDNKHKNARLEFEEIFRTII